MLAGGYLQITGWSKAAYKRGGELVAPREIEELLSRHPVPRHVFFVEAADLPLTPIGKVQKFHLVQAARELLEGRRPNGCGSRARPYHGRS